jgi:hypothetical protein
MAETGTWKTPAPTMKEECIAILSARKGSHRLQTPEETAREALKQVEWACRVGRLEHLHEALTQRDVIGMVREALGYRS